MKHYNREEWQGYKEGIPDEECRLLMTGHLRQCDSCLEVFLSLITEEEISQADNALSSGFTDGAMQLVRKEGRPQSANRRRGVGLAAYYVAAAALTLIFVGNGFFQHLVETGPRIVNMTAESAAAHYTVNLDWPNKVVGRAAQWIEDFETTEKGR